MLKSKRKFLVPAFVMLAALAFVGLVGCSHLPTRSEEPEGVVILKRNPEAYKVLGDSAYVEQRVSARSGGTIALLDVELHFPPGALQSDTLISICIPDLAVFKNQFGTDGLQFKEPVRVVMSYRDADLSGVHESSIAMAWFDEEIGSWDEIDCSIDFVNQTVTAYVNHFSAYALISD